MLSLDPDKRITVSQALRHPFITGVLAPRPEKEKDKGKAGGAGAGVAGKACRARGVATMGIALAFGGTGGEI